MQNASTLQWIWDQCERLTSVTLIVALIPDPDGLARCLAKTYALLAGSGIRNYEEKTRRDLDSNCMDNAIAFNINI